MKTKFWAAVRKTLAAVALTLIVVLSLAPGAGAASKYKTLYKFKGGNDGRSPTAGLVFDVAGNLYSATDSGGTDRGGTVFRLTPSGDGTWTQSVLHSFKKDGEDGVHPNHTGLIFDPAGNLYGTTINGGTYGDGAVFQLTPNGDGTWTESVLHSFAATDGFQPDTGVILDAAGSLYGTTIEGGTYNTGTVFQLTPNRDGTWTENVLHSFSGTDGYYLYAGLIFDSTGNLYGMATQGGAYGFGTIFQLTPNADGTWTENVLHSFNGTDGNYPFASLIFDPAGNLYGTTMSGGTYEDGAVFQLTPKGDGTWKERVLHSFDGKDGSRPFAGLILDPAGNLYGTTYSGGAYSAGTIFKLKHTAKGTWKETVLHSFTNKPAGEPWAGLIFDGLGDLFGTAAGINGKNNWGSVFEITP